MKFRVVPVTVALLVAAGCGGSIGSPSLPKTSGDAAGGNVHGSRDALVYAAVIRQLVTKDHGLGGAPSPYRHVYVLDGVVLTAADPMQLGDRPAKPFAEGLDTQIAAELQPFPPLTFVASRRLVITGATPGHVINRGVLITLGRITWVDAATAQVANNRWASGLNGQWLTYTVTHEDSSWRVSGVVGGTVAVS